MEIIVHEIAKDGLPDMDNLTGRVAFIFDGCIVSGWPLDDGESWEANSDVGRHGTFTGVTHWVEFPAPVWELPEAQPEARRVPSDPWRPINELEPSDDLFWFARWDGRSAWVVDEPRKPQHGGYDADEWDWFAPAEAPPINTPNPVRAEQPEGEWKLPCDVRLPPATTITAGCDLSTLVHAMECRKDAGVVHFPPKSAPAAPVGVDE